MITGKQPSIYGIVTVSNCSACFLREERTQLQN